jgi:hypothetical protein
MVTTFTIILMMGGMIMEPPIEISSQVGAMVLEALLMLPFQQRKAFGLKAFRVHSHLSSISKINLRDARQRV